MFEMVYDCKKCFVVVCDRLGLLWIRYIFEEGSVWWIWKYYGGFE